MENCFRFLINVDQCLNMSYFDIFFYKLESQHKFHQNAVQLFGDSADSSLRNAITDIRMYLDKYPYHVGDFQIIVAMRSTFCSQASRWDETMLYRLLQLDYELRRARIFINSSEQTEKALNLVMLYDADFSAELPVLENYKSSIRLKNDCAMLLSHILPAGTEPSQEALEQALAAYTAARQHDAAAASLLHAFLAFRRTNEERYRQMEDDFDFLEPEDAVLDSLHAEFTSFVKNHLCNFQIFEEQIDRNNRRQNILSLLRVTEFINMSVEPSPQAIGSPTKVSLAQRCENNWKQVWQDAKLEHRYATMLRAYQFRLNAASAGLERPDFQTTAAKDLPDEKIPADHAIVCTDGIFADPDARQNGSDLKHIIGQFVENHFSLRSVQRDWADAYTRSKQLLEKMDYALKDYAENLSRQYSAALEQRKQDSIAWRNSFYMSNPDTENDISRLAYERDQRLQQLKNPHMTPSLSFQDQLNMENALEQGNLTIKFYTQCLSTVNAIGFFILLAVCALFCFAHYSFLQPYVFQAKDTMLSYLIYLAGIVLLMLLCWAMPYEYFRRKLISRIKALQADAEKYINGYYAKAEQFCTYINLLNQLDYITRYHRLLCQAHNASHKLSQGYLWHKVQVRRHLNKLQFFQGLMELGDAPEEDYDDKIIPAIDGDQVSDIIDSQIYWPQS